MSFDWKVLPELSHAAFYDAVSHPVDYPVHLGTLSEELLAARDGSPLLVPLADRTWLRCNGADAQSFLHHQLTSDINHLSPEKWQHSSWCTAKGRMLASFVVVNSANRNTTSPDKVFYLQVASELRPSIAKRLKMYVLRAKVNLSETDDLVSIGLAAKVLDAARILAAAGLPHPEKSGDCLPFADGWVARLNDKMLQITVDIAQAATLFSVLSKTARPAGLAAWHWLEIQAGLPMVRQATQEEFVPQMVNFDKLGGVSFQKGCYPGQEIVARTQYLGKVKRHLYRVHAETPLVPGMSLSITDADGAHAVGVIANAANSPDGGFDALAVILETAVNSAIHADRPDGPALSSIALVAA